MRSGILAITSLFLLISLRSERGKYVPENFAGVDSMQFMLRYVHLLDSSPDRIAEIELTDREVLYLRNTSHSYLEIKSKKDSAIAYRKEYYLKSRNIKSEGPTFHANAIGKWKIYSDKASHKIIKHYDYDTILKYNVYQLRDKIKVLYKVDLMNLSSDARVTIITEIPKYIVKLREHPKIRVITVDARNGNFITEQLIEEKE